MASAHERGAGCSTSEVEHPLAKKRSPKRTKKSGSTAWVEFKSVAFPHKIAYLPRMRKPSILACFLALIFTVQSTFGPRCPRIVRWNPDYEQDYAIGITDVLAILGIFGATDADQDGMGFERPLRRFGRVQLRRRPTEPCLYEDAFGVCGGEGLIPELLIGTWQFPLPQALFKSALTPTAMSGSAASRLACKTRNTMTCTRSTQTGPSAWITPEPLLTHSVITANSPMTATGWPWNSSLKAGLQANQPSHWCPMQKHAVPLHRHQRRRLGVRHCVPFGNKLGIARARR